MLLSISSDSKTVKGQKFGYLTGVLYLAPADVSGFNTCPMASAGCKKACLYTAGRGAFSNVQKARIDKTRRFYLDRQAFMVQLWKDVHHLVRKAEKAGLYPAVRLNGTSDILVHEFYQLMQFFKDVVFYDYTKVANRFGKSLPDNYSLTFSRSESNELEALELLECGHNVAVVFEPGPGGVLPILWNGFPVIDGDLSDLRFLDPKGVVVGLKAKGQARKDASGFVVPASSPAVQFAP
jgi:hypothetical protein